MLPRSLLIRARRDERSEEHTSELQSRLHLVCRLLLEKKKKAGNRDFPIDPVPAARRVRGTLSRNVRPPCWVLICTDDLSDECPSIRYAVDTYWSRERVD